MPINERRLPPRSGELPTLRTVVLLAATLAGHYAYSHHSALIFDRESVVAFEGTVTHFGWANPHVYIHVETTDATGSTVEWELETDATPILTRSGWSRDSLAPGDRVLVRANPDKNPGRTHALLVSITKQDGEVLAARSYFLRKDSDPRNASGASSLAGVWELNFSDYSGFYEVWDRLELTAAGIASRDSYDVLRDSPEAQCIAIPSPGVLVAPYLNEIVIGDDRILIRNERWNLERVVYMDSRSHPDDIEPTNQGHSIGWWEGDTLVVDTIAFEHHRSPILGRGVESGPDKHVIERYTLNDDGTQIEIDFVMEDPDYLAEPFASRVVWHYAPHFEMLGFGCDLENSSRYTQQ
jgi:hypothetical protein